jgi:ribonuclease BN (tRNA processing enzyme)
VRVWVVGSGTLIPQPHRGSPAHWVEAGTLRVLMDCGAGALRTLARLGLGWQGLSHLILTHFHTDHVGELAALLFALKNGVVGGRRAPLTILGPTGLNAHLVALAQAHGDHIRDPGFPLVVQEVQPGESWLSEADGLQIRTLSTRHSLNSMAVRLEVEGQCVGYTGDAGPRPELGPFFRGCNLLISECSHPDGKGMETHLTPGDLAGMAREAAPDLLIPVHCYPPLEPADVPGLLEKAGYSGRVVPGSDGLGIVLEKGGAEVLEVRAF